MAQIGLTLPGIGKGMLYGGSLIATVSGISAILCLIDEAKAKDISNDPKGEYQKSGAFAGLVELLGHDMALGAVRMKAEGKTNQQIIEATVDQLLTPKPPET